MRQTQYLAGKPPGAKGFNPPRGGKQAPGGLENGGGREARGAPTPRRLRAPDPGVAEPQGEGHLP